MRPLVLLDTGFGSVAVETADGVIFRVARHAGAAEGHALEARLLPLLRRRLPVGVPDPRWRVEPEAAFPFGAIGYRRLAGEPLRPALAEANRDAIGADLGRFLVSLHGVPPEDACEVGLPKRDLMRDSFPRLCRDVLPVLRERLSAGEYDAVRRWAREFEADEEVDRFAPAVRHGDLWYGNVLVDDAGTRVVGVVDWENAALGDPAADLARQLHLGEAFLEAVLGASGEVNDALRHRIRRRWELLEFAGIRTAAALDDEDELSETVEKLRAGPILGAAAGNRRRQSKPA